MKQVRGAQRKAPKVMKDGRLTWSMTYSNAELFAPLIKNMDNDSMRSSPWNFPLDYCYLGR